jgi:hypothetical protein
MLPTPAELFTFREESLLRAASRTRRRLAATVAATGAIVVAVHAAAFGGQGSGLGTLAFSLALLGALATATLVRRMRRLRARWTSFAISLESEAVSRRVDGFAPVRIARAEIASVGEGPRGLVVRDRAGRALLVPREIDGYDRLRSALAAWAPVTGARAPTRS